MAVNWMVLYIPETNCVSYFFRYFLFPTFVWQGSIGTLVERYRDFACKCSGILANVMLFRIALQNWANIEQKKQQLYKTY